MQCGCRNAAAPAKYGLLGCAHGRLVEERFERIVQGLHPRRVVDRRLRASEEGLIGSVAIGEDVIHLVVLPLLERRRDAIDVEARVIGGGDQVANVLGLKIDRLERVGNCLF